MAYQTSRRAKTSQLTPEEYIVLQALNEFCFEPTMVGADNFAPIKLLHAKYREYAKNRADCPPHLILGPHAFGAALRRVFDIDPERKVQKRWGGKAVWGYSFVQGPGTIKAGNTPGRKRLMEVRNANAHAN